VPCPLPPNFVCVCVVAFYFFCFPSASDSSLALPVGGATLTQDSHITRAAAALRELSWNGIPAEVRPDVWRLLSGYLPANIDRREITLERKRAEYQDFVQQYYITKGPDTDTLTHQIQVR
jgi:hypothetical protein